MPAEHAKVRHTRQLEDGTDSFKNHRRNESRAELTKPVHLLALRYSSYSFLTSALDGVRGQSDVPVALYPREEDLKYPLHRILDGPQSWSGHRS
jgi:hypothetical protein